MVFFLPMVLTPEKLVAKKLPARTPGADDSEPFPTGSMAASAA